MNYKVRPGIVLTKICGVHVLIPSRQAFPACSTIRRLPMLWAATWDLLDRQEPEEKLLKVHRILTKQSDEAIRAAVDRFCRELCAAGFLIPAEEEKHDEQADA